MSVNTMSFEQAAPLLKNITEQATGKAVLTPVNETDFVSVGTTALSAGYDPVINAITQLVGRTIFSIRPYRRKLADMQVDNQRFGSITRKLKIGDKDWENSAEFALTDGQSVDPWVVNKPNMLQLNFYGANAFSRHYTIFKNQLDNAFQNSAQFGEFISMVVQNNSDMIEQKIESVTRALICNFIAAKLDANNGVIHLLTEYNAETGEEVTATTVYSPTNFPSFIYWLYGKLETIAGLMSERSQLYQMNVTGKPINQHTEDFNLKVKLYGPIMNAINARVKSTTFNDSYLKMADTEPINYWQAITTPNAINVTPTYINNTGAVKTGSAVNVNNVVGIMFDRDAMGVTTVNQWSMSTPMNPRGGYANMFHNFTERWWSDFTEKGVILCMD